LKHKEAEEKEKFEKSVGNAPETNNEIKTVTHFDV
jgi:hypothetical protein